MIKSDGSFYKIAGTLEIRNKKIYARICDINDAKTNFRAFPNVQQLVVMPFIATTDAMMI